MIRHRLAALLRWLATSLDRPESNEPPEWIKHDGSELKQAAITVHVAPSSRELGITSPPAADVWRFYEVPDVDMQPVLPRARHNPQGYL